MTRMRTIGSVLAVTALLVAGACSDDDEPEATTDTDETTEAAADDGGTTAADDAADPYGSTEAPDDGGSEPAQGATVAVADSDLGPILVDGEGNTLYLFTSDTQGEASTCTDGCAAAWPALTGPVTAGEGVDEALIGTVANADGTEQATYDDWPLYYYAQDTGPGDTTGQGVGGVWWVVDPEGNAVES